MKTNCDFDLKASLLSAARAIDKGDPELAVNTLRGIPLVRSDPPTRLVILALWRKVLRRESETNLPEHSVEAFNQLGSAVEAEVNIWSAYHAIPVLEKEYGAVDTAAMLASILWDRILESPEGMFSTSLELFFRGGDIERFDFAWKTFIANRKDYVPSYWNFLLHAKTLRTGSHENFVTELKDYISAADRDDLEPLIEIYLLKMRQADPAKIFEAALALKNPEHRYQVAECITGMGYMAADLKRVTAIYPKLAKGTKLNPAAISLMDARIANANGNWSDAIKHSKKAEKQIQYKGAAELLRANALANQKRTAQAHKILDRVTQSEDTASFLKARAEFIKVTANLVKQNIPLPDAKNIQLVQDAPGKPLAQSLWVGPRLRWIERLAITSYLKNGWRFQLYVYEDPDNAPEGCEVLDANTIIPKKEVFREGQNSGLHAGSVGAFSDLFRYRLLQLRGGMWTDTDVINFKKYDPDGQRFISTEISDAGLVTLNGALMAAPAGDPFVTRAYERADQLLRSEDMFFTRIGPYLLAELMCEAGVETIDLMPPGFLSTVYWMNTAVLLKPYDEVMARPEMRDMVNIHVYTEMWRMLGLGLDKPPSKDTFLGKLYADLIGDDEQAKAPKT